MDEIAGQDDSNKNMRHFKLVISYDGTDFAGWQVQPDAVTIQGTLATAIRRLTGENVLPQGSGRTDAGVHALAQVASFCLACPIPAENLMVALNNILPPSVRVLEASEVPAQFHARKAARAKTYRYRIFRGDVCLPFLARYVWHYPYPLDEAAMRRAAREVIGEHDFSSFADVDPEQGRAGAQASNRRTVFSSDWEAAGDEFIYTVSGSGFLHHMVRNLVGTFILVGKCTLAPEDLMKVIQAQNRTAAGATAPAKGLYLVSVQY